MSLEDLANTFESFPGNICLGPILERRICSLKMMPWSPGKSL